MKANDHAEPITLQSVTKFIVGLVGISIVLSLWWYFSEVVVYILISAVLAIMTRSTVNGLEGMKLFGWSIPRGVAAMLTLLMIWVLLGVLLSALLPLVFTKLYQLTNIDLRAVLSSIEEPLSYAQHYFQQLLSLPESDLSLTDALMSLAREHLDFKSINTIFTSFVGMAASSMISFFSISFITFFFIKDEDLFYNMVSSIFPSKYNENIERAIKSISHLLSRYFVGLLAESVVIATAVTLVMICFGMPAHDALFMGMVMGILNVIPYAGPFIGVCICIFLSVASPIASLGVGGTVAATLFSIAIIKGMDDFLLQPNLYSERVKAQPLEIFIVI